jgi:hypothetical protein
MDTEEREAVLRRVHPKKRKAFQSMMKLSPEGRRESLVKQIISHVGSIRAAPMHVYPAAESLGSNKVEIRPSTRQFGPKTSWKTFVITATFEVPVSSEAAELIASELGCIEQTEKEEEERRMWKSLERQLAPDQARLPALFEL